MLVFGHISLRNNSNIISGIDNTTDDFMPHVITENPIIFYNGELITRHFSGSTSLQIGSQPGTYSQMVSTIHLAMNIPFRTINGGINIESFYLWATRIS